MARPAQTERNNRILEMYNQGMKHAEISKEIGLSTVSISSILRSMPGYKRRGTDKPDKVRLKVLAEDREAKEELRYMHMLDKFSKAVNQVNKLGEDGVSIKNLKGRMKQLAPVFLALVEE